MGFERLSEILKKIQERYPDYSKRLNEAHAVSHWEKAVGVQIAKHARPMSVKDGVLLVEVDHPIWRSELHHRKKQILNALNAKASENPQGEVLSDIVFIDVKPVYRR